MWDYKITESLLELTDHGKKENEMELFRTCCGSSQLKFADDTHEIKPCARAKPRSRLSHEKLSYLEERASRNPINITRIKCHEGDDYFPPAEELDPPLETRSNAISQQKVLMSKVQKHPAGPNTQIFLTKFTAPTPKGDEIENDIDNLSPKETPPFNYKEKYHSRSDKYLSIRTVGNTTRKAPSTKGLDYQLLEACRQLSRNRSHRSVSPCKKSRVSSKSPVNKKPKPMVPSENSAFSFCPSVVRLELTERYKFEAGLAVTLAKARDCLKNSQKKPAYYISDTPSSTGIGTVSHCSSVKSIHFDTNSPVKQILV